MTAIESSNLATTAGYNTLSSSTVEPPSSSPGGYQAQLVSAGAQSNAQAAGNNFQIMNHFVAPCGTESSPVSPQLEGFRYGDSNRCGGDSWGYLNGMLNTLAQMVNTLSTMIKGLFNSENTRDLFGAGDAQTGSGNSQGELNLGGANQSYPTPTVGFSNTPVTSALDVNSNDNGMISVRTLDGYTIRTEGKDQAWSITGPDGKTTRIWGDPHVSESDGDKWDFLNRSTFMFGLNKATIEVVPAGNGQTFSARLTIYSDRQRVTIDGIEKDKPVVTAASSDGVQHDAALADGEIYSRIVTNTGEAWISEMTGRVVVATR